MWYQNWPILALLGKFFSQSPQQAQGITTDAAAFAQSSFDYVIIGGGTSGLVLAARLTEDPSVRVGVIEAGQALFDDENIDTPVRFGQGLFNPEYDWTVFSVPQDKLNGRRTMVNQGKMLGGSSAFNFLIWQRGSKGDYDAWRELGIGGGWDWEGLLPYFKKTENVAPGPSENPYNFTAGEGIEQGHSGPLPVSYNNFYTHCEGPYGETLLSTGVPLNPDPDSGDTTGLFNAAASRDIKTGNRTHSARNYLLPVAHRPNLAVLVGAHATKIQFSDEKDEGNAVATGVRFTANGSNFTVSAEKEVVLSAGAIFTPQLLELSGIGDSSRLSALDIPVVVDNSAVGENLQDHQEMLQRFHLTDPNIPTMQTVIFGNSSYTEHQRELYLKDQKGFFTYSLSALSFHPLQHFWKPEELTASIARLQEEIEQANVNPFIKKQFDIQLNGIKEGILGQVELIFTGGLLLAKETGMIDIFNFASRPFSRGYVHIGTTDPFSHPLVDTAYLQYSFDEEVLLRVAKFVRKLTQTAPLSDYIAGPLGGGPNTDEEFLDYIHETMATEWHYVGTASLGPRGEGGVVDENLTVYGTSNLRVVDASVIPMQIGTHIQSTVYAIAEKASDIIKASQQPKTDSYTLVDQTRPSASMEL